MKVYKFELYKVSIYIYIVLHHDYRHTFEEVKLKANLPIFRSWSAWNLVLLHPKHSHTNLSWSNPVRALVIWHSSNLNFSTCLLLLYQSPSRILHVPHTNHWCLPVVNSLCDSVWATLLCCVTLLCEARLTQVDPDQNPALGYHSVGRWWRSKIIFSSSSVFH